MSAWWALAILAASLMAKAESAIVIRPMTQLTQTKAIFLSDLSEFNGIDGKWVTQLGSIKLADGPQPGEKIEFSGAVVSAALRGHRSWKNVPDRPNIVIPSKIFVENVGEQVNEARVRMEIIEKWQSQCGCRIELTELNMPGATELSALKKWQLRLPSAPARGTFTVAVEGADAKGQSRSLWIRGRVGHFKTAPVAKRQLQFGERIQPDDFSMEERDVTFARDAIPTGDQLVGRKMRQSVAANEIVFVGFLEPEKALKRGDQVKVSVGEESWEVVLVGVAEQDGFIGDTVKIRNPQSNQMVSAVVTGRGEVKVQ